jgi:hypothetical protein
MTRAMIDEDWPILEFYFPTVLDEIERPLIAKPRKVSRRAVLESFARTRSKAKTAHALGISPSLVNEVLLRAFRIAKRLAGITPDDED